MQDACFCDHVCGRLEGISKTPLSNKVIATAGYRRISASSKCSKPLLTMVSKPDIRRHAWLGEGESGRLLANTQTLQKTKSKGSLYTIKPPPARYEPETSGVVCLIFNCISALGTWKGEPLGLGRHNNVSVICRYQYSTLRNTCHERRIDRWPIDYKAAAKSIHVFTDRLGAVTCLGLSGS
jgi:hypothetical protein